MTTIAWDGRIFAADRRMTTDNGYVATGKIIRAGRWVYGGCGDASDIERVTEWLKGGALPAERPRLSQGEKSHGIAVDIRTAKLFLVDGKDAALVPMSETKYAAGSGGDFARSAMVLGKNAIEAVEHAASLDSSTGNGVDHVVIAPRRRRSQ